ncbi:MAG: cytochrome c [Pedosphaera sp.]|nr:cytochrome c [Pedosphaera sp.]
MSDPVRNYSVPPAHLSESHDVRGMHARLLADSEAGLRGFSSFNLGLGILAAGMVFWGGSYLSHFSGRFDGNEFSEIPAPRSSGGSGGSVDPDAKVRKQGKQIYAAICGLCHNDDGMGKDGIAPPLVGSDWVNAEGVERMVRLVLHGLQGPIKINATTSFNIPAQSMPPQADAVGSDENIAAVLTYVRSSWGNKGSAVKPEAVKAVRAAVADRKIQWAVSELEQIPAGGAAPMILTPEQLKERLKALPADQLKTVLQDLLK